jgi:hypothetical protein
MSCITPDMISVSGREDLPLDDRIGLLEQDILLFQMQVAKFKTGEGSSIHAINSLIGAASGTITLYNRDGKLSVFSMGYLPKLECLMMAWKRGALSEYQRVDLAQRKLDCKNGGSRHVARNYPIADGKCNFCGELVLPR